MKIFCIDKNYGAEGGRLVFFMKPDTALLRNNDPFFVPDFTREVDCECELVVRINRVGRSIAQKFAHRYYSEVGLGINFTARDLQRRAAVAGLPWEACTAFDRSAALSAEFFPLAELGGDVQNLHFEMLLDGQVRQRGHTAEMTGTVDEIIAHVSQFVTLKMGDLIYTGTPAGAEPVAIGNHLTARLEGREVFDFFIK
jgi:2-keto-4-pentenoate hydratase/2-oxohepta-3-ene-1,7-dioic acid hydratase in catechol pathway